MTLSGRLLSVGLLVLTYMIFMATCNDERSEIPENKCGGEAQETLATCGPSKDVVLTCKTSYRRALLSLKLGASRLLLEAAGRCTNAYRFNIVRFNNKGLDRNTSFSTSEPNMILTALSHLEDNPLEVEQCTFGCCCSRALFDFLPDLVMKYKSATYFLILECFYTPNDEVLDNLRSQLRSTHVVVIRLKDTFCSSSGGSVYDLGLSSTEFYLESSDVGKALEGLSIFYRSPHSGALMAQICRNATLGVTMLPKTRGIGMTLEEGHLIEPPLINDPNGLVWKGETRVFLNTSGAAFLALYPSSTCGKGWTLVRDRCYRVQGPMRWEAASTSCRRMGATLLTIFDPSDAEVLEHAVIRNQLENVAIDHLLPSSLWLGLHDGGLTHDFEWGFLAGFASLKDLNYSNWNRGQPSPLIPRLKRCGAIDVQSAKWHTNICSSLLYSVCTRPSFMFDFQTDEQSESMRFKTFKLPTNQTIHKYISASYIQPGLWTITVNSFSRCAVDYYMLQ